MTLDMPSIIEIARLTTISLGMGFGALLIWGVTAMIKAPEPTIKLMLELVQSESVIRFGTAVVIILAIFGLRLTDRISAEATIATLSGIAGYLLGSHVAGRSTNLPPQSNRDAAPNGDWHFGWFDGFDSGPSGFYELVHVRASPWAARRGRSKPCRGMQASGCSQLRLTRLP